jgi:acyl-CoA thioesterase FadM
MPGVMIIRAMAQVARILVLNSIPERKTKLVLLAAINEAKFRRPVVPGDQLRIEMKVIKRKATIAKMNGVATVNGVVVAEAEMMCKLADRPVRDLSARPVAVSAMLFHRLRQRSHHSAAMESPRGARTAWRRTDRAGCRPLPACVASQAACASTPCNFAILISRRKSHADQDGTRRTHFRRADSVTAIRACA